MASSGLVISQIQDVTIANFHNSSILESGVVEAIAKELYALIDEQARKKLILDFHIVKFLSSQMLGVLIAAHKKSAEIGGRMIICGLKPDLHKVFKITKLDKLLEFAPDEEQALNSFDIFMQP